MSNIVVIITAAFAAGIWCANYIAGLLPIVYIGSFVVLVILLWRIYRQKQVVWLMAGLFFIIGMLRFIHDDALSVADISHYRGQQLTIYGSIAEMPQVTVLEDEKIKVRYVVSVNKTQSDKTKSAVTTGTVSLSARQPRSSVIAQQGDEIRATGEVISLHGYNNPGQYDSVAAAQRQGIRVRMSVQHEISIVAKDNSTSWKQAMAVWRAKIVENIHKVMPPNDGAILVGMLFGGYGGIPKEIVAEFATTGIVHILSVSGSHIALVAGVITVLGKRILRRFRFADKAVPLLAVFFITFYAAFCGLTPPVLRSLYMGLIGLGAVCLEREKDAAVALSISVLCMLVYQPALIYDLSFQLSFASTAGLVFFYAKTVKMLSVFPDWLVRPLAVTIAAQVGVLPFIAWYFNSFSLISFAANVIIVPMIEGIVILGLFGAFAGLLIGVVGDSSMVICSLALGVVLQINRWLAAVPFAKIYVSSIGMIGGVFYYVLLGWVYGYKPKNMVSLTEVIKRWPDKSAVIVLMLILSVIIYGVYPRPLTVHFIDVGQGDAALVVTPHGRAIVIDTGGTMGENTDFDIGDRVVLPYLRHYGIGEVDYLFLTHGHQDHAGGAAAIAKGVFVKNIMLPRENITQPVANLLRSSPNSTRIGVYEGQKIEIDGVDIRVVHADTGVNRPANNEVSSVIHVRYGSRSFLFTGDLPAQGEEAILESGMNISSTVLKVGHHGSKSSSTVAFLQRVAPEYAVISVGHHNSFGHPHEEVIQRLLAQHSKIYRTDQQGAIVFMIDGDRILVDTFIR
jgi:competence protein ComEC